MVKTILYPALRINCGIISNEDDQRVMKEDNLNAKYQKNVAIKNLDWIQFKLDEQTVVELCR